MSDGTKTFWPEDVRAAHDLITRLVEPARMKFELALSAHLTSVEPMDREFRVAWPGIITGEKGELEMWVDFPIYNEEGSAVSYDDDGSTYPNVYSVRVTLEELNLFLTDRYDYETKIAADLENEHAKMKEELDPS